jgi:hypothetical protein
VNLNLGVKLFSRTPAQISSERLSELLRKFTNQVLDEYNLKQENILGKERSNH